MSGGVAIPAIPYLSCAPMPQRGPPGTESCVPSTLFWCNDRYMGYMAAGGGIPEWSP